MLDDLPDRGRVPAGVVEVEVERGVQFVGPQILGEPRRVGHPRLGDEDAVAGVLIDDPAPAPVDVVDLVSVPVRMRAGAAQVVGGTDEIGEVRILGEAVRDVDAEAVDAEIEPEPENVLEFGHDLGVRPVQIGLLRREQVQIPLPVADPGPGRTAEARLPVVRWLGAVRAATVAEQESLALRAARLGGQRGLEPRVLIGGVVGHQVDDHAEVVVVRLANERVRVVQRAVDGVDVAVVGDVVAEVGLRGRVERREPDRVDAERGQVRELRPYAVQVADSVAVGIGEAPRIDLIDHRGAPPRPVRRRIAVDDCTETAAGTSRESRPTDAPSCRVRRIFAARMPSTTPGRLTAGGRRGPVRLLAAERMCRGR